MEERRALGLVGGAKRRRGLDLWFFLRHGRVRGGPYGQPGPVAHAVARSEVNTRDGRGLPSGDPGPDLL